MAKVLGATVLFYLSQQVCEVFGQTQVLTEFARYQDGSLSSSAQTNCHALGACGEITTLKVSGSSNALQCSGARGCQACGTITSAWIIRANGYMALTGTDSVTAHDYIDCWGEASCSQISQVTSPLIECDSLNACKDITLSQDSSKMSDVDEVNGDGMFSLQGAIIYSNSDSENTFGFYGWYAGYGATIHCQNGDICTVYCKNNGCYGLTLICDDGVCNNVAISCDDPDNACPSVGSFDDSDNKLLFDQFSNYQAREYDVDDIDDNNELLCNSNSDYTSCNDYQDSNCYQKTLTISEDKNICCRGVYGCKQSTLNIGDNTNTYCTGGYSCIQSDITGTSGSYGNGANIECGRRACVSSTIEYIDNVIAVGYAGLESTVIENANIVGCYSELGCEESEISDTKTIYGTGRQALYNAAIDNSGLTDFEVYLLGYSSGEELSITCDNSILNSCKIYCYNEETCSNLGQVNCNCDQIILEQSTVKPTSTPTSEPTCSAYISVNEQYTYSEASSYCLDNYGTTLASVTSDDELNEIVPIVRSAANRDNSEEVRFWIGLYLNDNNEWVWEDGTISDYRYNLQEPIQDGNDCMTIVWKNTDEQSFTAIRCDRSRYFACNSNNC